MRFRLASVLGPIFALTGFSALTLQVVWQRVISLHSGVDLASTTTVVAAFLGGLGFGSLLGGWLADRAGPHRSLLLFAIANVGIGIFAWLSLLLFYDAYRGLAPHLQSTFASFAFNTAVLLVPTTLMGVSLPLVARAVTGTVGEAGPLIGRMYALNTVGAGAGAALTGWFFLGALGFTATTRLAGTLNVVAAVSVALVYRTIARRPPMEIAIEPADATSPVGAVSATDGRIWPWYVIYAMTGAVALGFEQVFFRVIDTEMRSNSYSFAHVLTLYLLLFGGGAAIGSRLVRRAGDARRWFLSLQFGVGIAAMAALVVLVQILPHVGFVGSRLRRYFLGEGYNTGFGHLDSARAWLKIIGVYGAVPLLLMGVPVLLMGMSYPFVQKLVSTRVDALGRRTGSLLFANIAGNVGGTLLTGFVLIDRIGTAGTYRLLTAILVVAGAAAAWLASPRRRLAAGGAVAALAVTVIGLSPSNQRLYAFFVGADDDHVLLAEDHACASTIRLRDGLAELLVNGSIQNNHPYDDFHVLIGMLPALAQPAPRLALAIGLGIGSTTYGMLSDPRLEHVRTVELCGGEYDLVKRLANGSPERPEFATLLDDPRYVEQVGDGRKFLLADDNHYDIITVDTLRSTAAHSGSLYSKEFYELVRKRLAPSGIVAQWVPTPRVANTVTQVFPYVVALRVESYDTGSVFFLASQQPIDLDPAVLLQRFAGVAPSRFTSTQATALRNFLGSIEPICYADGGVLHDVPSEEENRDLRPRDEYFANNPPGHTLPKCG